MSAVRDYLLRLTACAFLVSLAAMLVSQEKLRRIVKLVGACLIAVAALQPLIGLDLSALPELVAWTDPARTEAIAEAKAKNDALLEQLIRTQTEEALQQALDEQGIAVDFSLSLRYDDALGLPLPWQIRLSGVCSESEQAQLRELLRDTFGIPEERQVWSSDSEN